MTTSGRLPGDGNLQLGPVTVPPGRILASHGLEPVVWATDEPTPRPGPLWWQLSRIAPDTGLVPILLTGLDESTARPWEAGEFGEPCGLDDIDQLDAARVLAEGWDASLAGCDEDDEELLADLAPFGPRFPGLAPRQAAEIGDDSIRQVLEALPPARVGLVGAARPADVPAILGWMGSDQYWLLTNDDYYSSLALAAVLRSWEDRFGARLLEVGFAGIKLLVNRPPRDLQAAQCVAAEHYAACDECANHLGVARTTIPEITSAILDAPIWSFWWD